MVLVSPTLSPAIGVKKHGAQNSYNVRQQSPYQVI